VVVAPVPVLYFLIVLKDTELVLEQVLIVKQ
jgi:hypothetical protein